MMTAQELKDYLQRIGITQEEFADYIGVHGRTVRRWVQGQEMPKLVGLFVALDPIEVIGKQVIKKQLKEKRHG